MVDTTLLFREPPSFSQEDIDSYKRTDNWLPYLVKWFDYIRTENIIFSSIIYDCDVIVIKNQLHYMLITGSMRRIDQLLNAYIIQYNSQKYDVALDVLYRCAWEAICRTIWIISKNTEERFEYYICTSVKSDLDLKYIVEKNIKKRNGNSVEIEERILRSINKVINATGFSDEHFQRKYKYISFKDILADIYDVRNGQVYNMYCLSSHAIHNTFSEIYMHHIVDNNNVLSLKNGYKSDPSSQIPVLSHCLLKLLLAFVNWSFKDDFKTDIIDILEGMTSEYIEYVKKSLEGDWQPVS